MRRSMWLVTLGAALAMLAGQAALAQESKPNSQQEKMTACSADAKAKGLHGIERKTFMKDCLSGKGEAATTSATAGENGAAAATGNSQQEKMKSCSADAKAKGLHGAERKTFMKDCLSGASAH